MPAEAARFAGLDLGYGIRHQLYELLFQRALVHGEALGLEVFKHLGDEGRIARMLEILLQRLLDVIVRRRACKPELRRHPGSQAPYRGGLSP